MPSHAAPLHTVAPVIVDFMRAHLVWVRGGVQVNNATIKKDLQSLHISAARQVDVSNGRNAIIIFVPYKLLKGFRKIQKILVEELEKRFR